MSLANTIINNEKVTINGKKVKEKLYLNSKNTFKPKIQLPPGTFRTAFIADDCIHVVINKNLYKLNLETGLFTNIGTSPVPYIFTDGANNIFACKLRTGEYNGKFVNTTIYKYNKDTQTFTDLTNALGRGTNRFPDPDQFCAYAVNGRYGSTTYCWTRLHDVETGIEHDERDIIGDSGSINENGRGIIDPPLFKSDYVSSKANANPSLRTIVFNNNIYINKTQSSKFDMFEFSNSESKWHRYEYKASSEFSNQYNNGTLAIVDGKLWMYGTNSQGITKRIQWTGTTYDNEEIIDIGNVNNTTILQLNNKIYAIGLNGTPNIFIENIIYEKEV